ncbi:hypothetical protein BH20CHL6_BH20CHL6_08630 [soil metagenome]
MAQAALRALLAGPTASELAAAPGLSSGVPGDTLLFGVSIADGVARVDLSEEFGSGGGEASLFGRIAQVVYTVTQFSTVRAVELRLDGRPAPLFTGDGAPLDRPAVRDDYLRFLPPVFVDRPWSGQSVDSPLRLTGRANVFEARFFAEVSDAGGRSLGRTAVMATCGSGCWGDFDVRLPFNEPGTRRGWLSVWTASPRDGSVQDLRRYPIVFGSGG